MKKVLIIEDDLVLRENTAEFLKEEGFKVIEAQDGLIGVQMAIKHVPDIIICDIAMPNMDGYEFYKTIQKLKPTSVIPLIYLSAKIERNDVREGMQLGADDYITKPFKYNELLNAIQIRLQKHNKICEVQDEKFFKLIDNPLMGVFLYKEHEFIYINKAFVNIFKIKKEDIQNISIKDLIHPAQIKNMMKEIKKCFLGKSGSVHIHFTPSNKKGMVELYGSLIRYKGEKVIIGNVKNEIYLNKLEENKETEEVIERVHKLTSREIQIIKLLCEGLSSIEISKIINTSVRTVDSHRLHIMNKTNTKNVASIIMFAIRNKIINLK